MPSLKDLRNRIASVKATQKITKAMQMVAAAKLRRAQAAAEAARPYAERMETVLANLAAGVSGIERAARCSPAPARTRCICWSSAPPSAACAAPSTPRSPASPATRRMALKAEGKTVKIICVGKKGYDHAAPPVREGHHRADRPARLQAGRLRQRRGDRAEDPDALFEAGEFDVATLFFSRFKSVIAQIPTAQQHHPGRDPGRRRRRRRPRRLRVRARRGRDPRRRCCRATSPSRCSARILENAASEQGARMRAMDNATRNAGDMIKKQTQLYNRSRQAMITKELIEIISGAEAL